MVYNDFIYPKAIDYVNSTETTYDDKALALLDDLIKEFIQKLQS